jgi:hypothetical protein
MSLHIFASYGHVISCRVAVASAMAPSFDGNRTQRELEIELNLEMQEGINRICVRLFMGEANSEWRGEGSAHV